ncbi:MAG: preprotein translocase subunit SecG [Clostridia bacterium]|nr:preprotein translocase subunit SecG [Clostridia bacterium]
MTAVTIIINIVLIIVSIILILTVLMQQGQRQGLGAIGGGAETFFGKNKAKSYEGKLAKLTKICAVVFIVLAMVATFVSSMPDKDAAEIITEVEEHDHDHEEEIVETEDAVEDAVEETVEAETEDTAEPETEDATETEESDEAAE